MVLTGTSGSRRLQPSEFMESRKVFEAIDGPVLIVRSPVGSYFRRGVEQGAR